MLEKIESEEMIETEYCSQLLPDCVGQTKTVLPLHNGGCLQLDCTMLIKKSDKGSKLWKMASKRLFKWELKR